MRQDKTEHQYVYVVTRRDLTFPQQAVQAGHAAIESARQFLPPQAEHPSLIITAVRNEQKLVYWIDKFERLGIRFTVWREPDLNNEITSIATEPLSGDIRRKLRDLQLLKDPIAEDKNVK